MNSTFRRTTLVIVLGLASLVGFLFVRTELISSKQIKVEAIPIIDVKASLVADHLAHAVRFPTISFQDPADSPRTPFLEFHAYLKETFPLSHRYLKREVVGDYSLLFTWQGREKDLKPVLFLAHLDVVPAEGGTEALWAFPNFAGEIEEGFIWGRGSLDEEAPVRGMLDAVERLLERGFQPRRTSWAYPPFAGEIEEGYIWGRGSLDDKASVLGMLEAVERLLEHGFQPRRTLYFAFGHDEEIGGNGGAAKIAAVLQSRTSELEFILDEGGAIMDGVFPLVSRPVAFVGIAEKGYLNLELTVRSEGGHSSMPSENTALDILISALSRLGTQPFPARIEGGIRQMFEFLGPEMPLTARTVLANQWLLGNLIKNKLGQFPTTNAGIRTTLAITIIEGGTKENVLPTHARAILNLRILPGDTLEGVKDQVRQVIDDPRVTIRPVGVAREPSPESHINSWAFQTLQRTMGEIFPEALVAPFLVLGGTDSYHYQKLSPNIYRFTPVFLTVADLPRIHGVNERISVNHYAQCVKFYHQFIRNVSL